MINTIVKDVLSADPFEQRRSQAALLGVGPGMPLFWKPRMRLIAAIPVVRQGSTMRAPATDEEAIKGLNLQADQKGGSALQEDDSDDDAVRSHSTSVA
ncbi:hypothetical protein CBOM_06338 [Ceraceosorus bombacis]|uniref:Uncharacterized protein n=1 Tax=Ceraceosorus bombacis TaxID=401625 RepID=A0A0N7LBG1_9BASI|nr:hypothetical protein CBOM_06338 [Ceraceosorus bombacis]